MTPENVKSFIVASFDRVWDDNCSHLDRPFISVIFQLSSPVKVYYRSVSRSGELQHLLEGLWQFIIELQAYPRNSNITYWDSVNRTFIIEDRNKMANRGVEGGKILNLKQP
ncbi:hypothetical protein TNCV_873371 [Trichonephila clavipes]|nr:hypothetical protein TNCV_873371 [Trichonephila clavipes]